jgi:hypothetical protein
MILRTLMQFGTTMQNSERDVTATKLAEAKITLVELCFERIITRLLLIKPLVASKTNHTEPLITPKKRGPKKETNLVRDYAIVHAVETLRRYGYKLSRSHKQKNKCESACSIVGKALPGIREAGVEAVYRRVLRNRPDIAWRYVGLWMPPPESVFGIDEVLERLVVWPASEK